jgi:acetyl esterase/lipase
LSSFSNHPYLKTLGLDDGRIVPDTTRIASAGESAGGYLSIQSGLLFNHHPSAKIRAIAASYPAQYPDVASYNPRAEEARRDAMQEAIVDAYMAKAAERKLPARISSPWPEGSELVMAMVQTGRHREMMGDEEGLTLRGALDGAVDGEAPAIWVIQGDEDDLVRFSLPLSLSISAFLYRCLVFISFSLFISSG